MYKLVLRLCVAICLMIGCCANAYAAPAGPASSAPAAAQTVSLDDGTSPLTFPDISRIDPRLAVLGGGVLIGLIIASPGLELSEVLGIALGVIGSQYLYYSVAPRPPASLHPEH